MKEAYAVAAAHTLRSLIDFRAEQAPDRAAFVFPESGLQVNYGQLAACLRRLGKSLHSAPQGAPVGMLCGNGWATVQILLGAPYHGRPALILNLAAGDSQLAYMLNHSGCALVFADGENWERLQNIAGQCERAIKTIRIERDGDIGGAADLAEESPPPAAADRALLIYTSGTTGLPKGVLHSHRSLLSGGANTAAAHALSADDRALCVLPLYHCNGQCVTVLAPLVSGGSAVIPHKFSAGGFWNWLAEHQCTWFSAVPTILSRLLQGEAPSSSFPQLRFGRSASSALPPEVLRQFQKRFGVPVIETMGLTETAAQILSNPPPPAKGKVGSPGIAHGCEVRIVGENGRPAPADTEGEIAVRGDNVMLGYLGETPQPDGGWLLTGDLGKMDGDGYVFVTGRAKELIIKGGENISPREIDDALYAAPGVAEAAAFATPCAIYGQQPEAAAVMSPLADADEKRLIAFCEERVGKFKAPRRIHFVQSMPKGPSGKIQRLKLAAALAK